MKSDAILAMLPTCDSGERIILKRPEKLVGEVIENGPMQTQMKSVNEDEIGNGKTMIEMLLKRFARNTRLRNWDSMNLRDPSRIVASVVQSVRTNEGYASITIMQRENLEDGSVTLAIVV